MCACMQELCANVCVYAGALCECVRAKGTCGTMQVSRICICIVDVLECMWVYPCRPGVRRDRLIQVVSSLLEKGVVLEEYWLTCVDCNIVRSDMS